MIGLYESMIGLEGPAAMSAGPASPIAHAQNRVKKQDSASPPRRLGVKHTPGMVVWNLIKPSRNPNLRSPLSSADDGSLQAFAAMFVTVAGFLSPITQLPWKMAPSSMISAGVSMSL